MTYYLLIPKEFYDMGIRFETEEEAKAFSALIREELEIRIGKELSKQLSPNQLEEYDKVIMKNDKEACGRWLDKNYPGYKTIINEKRTELEQELLSYKSWIAGII